MKKVFIITIAILLLLGATVLYFDFFNLFTEEKKEEEVQEESDIKPVSFSPEEKKQLMDYLQKNQIMLSYYYERISNFPISFLATDLINWQQNPSLSEEKLDYITDNHVITNWQQDQTRGNIKYYIPLSDVYKHFEPLVRSSLAEPDSTDCMKYIEKYEIYVPTCEKSWRQNYEPLLSPKNEWGRIFYPNRAFLHKQGYYILEVITYDLTPAYQYYDKNELLGRFIAGQISAAEAQLEKVNKSILFMDEQNDQWLFLGHREAQ